MTRELTGAQQARYARHLLLDGWEGGGQERLLSASVRVRGRGAAARWAARYLAASGVGRLGFDEPSWAPELRGLGPWLVPEATPDALEIAPAEGASPAESAQLGSEAALRAVVALLRG